MEVERSASVLFCWIIVKHTTIEDKFPFSHSRFPIRELWCKVFMICLHCEFFYNQLWWVWGRKMLLPFDFILWLSQSRSYDGFSIRFFCIFLSMKMLENGSTTQATEFNWFRFDTETETVVKTERKKMKLVLSGLEGKLNFDAKIIEKKIKYLIH